eukprot:6422408-Alexandrium_andersonii.AAC.1
MALQRALMPWEFSPTLSLAPQCPPVPWPLLEPDEAPQWVGFAVPLQGRDVGREQAKEWLGLLTDELRRASWEPPLEGHLGGLAGYVGNVRSPRLAQWLLMRARR